jgi:hypothetical protein
MNIKQYLLSYGNELKGKLKPISSFSCFSFSSSCLAILSSHLSASGIVTMISIKSHVLLLAAAIGLPISMAVTSISNAQMTAYLNAGGVDLAYNYAP